MADWSVGYAASTLEMIRATGNTIVGMLQLVEMADTPIRTRGDVNGMLAMLRDCADRDKRVKVVLYHLNDNGTGEQVPLPHSMSSVERGLWELQCKYK